MSAGELAGHFASSKATLSAHFAVLREAGLVFAEKQGTTITYTLRLSVLEDALLGFAESLGIGFPARDPVASPKGEGST